MLEVMLYKRLGAFNFTKKDKLFKFNINILFEKPETCLLSTIEETCF